LLQFTRLTDFGMCAFNADAKANGCHSLSKEECAELFSILDG
jgi:hypothetical protein